MASVLGGFAGLGGGSIGHAVVDLVLNAGAYEGELAAAEGKTKASTASMGQGFSGFQQQVKSSFSTAQVAAVGFGAVAVAALGKAAVAAKDWGNEVYQLQKVTGQSAEDASKLAYVGDRLGVSTDKLTVGFGLLSKNIVNGSKNFDKYGIATKDAAGNTLPFTQILGEISDKFQTLQAGPDQAAFAMNVFGRSGRNLIPILQQGSGALQDFYAQAQASGLVLSQQGVDSARQFTIAMNELSGSVRGAEVQVGTQLLPVLTRLAQDATKAVELFIKIPGPIKASVLAFVALNGALVALRGIWSVTTGIIAKNAEALGANAAAAGADAAAEEADAAASKQNAASKGILNSAMLENVAGLAALTKGTQDAIAEFDAFKAGNYPGVLHAITSELSFYTTGIVKTTPDLGAFQNGLSSINAELKAGTITTQDATTQAQALAKQYGVTLPQAETDFINAAGTATTATTQLSGAQGQLTRTTTDAAKAAYKHAEAIHAEREALLSEAGGFTGLIASMDTVKTDEAALNKLREQGKQGTTAFSAAVRQTTIDQLSYRDSLRQVADQLRQSGDGMGKIKGILREMAAQAGISGNAFKTAFHDAFSSAGADITNLNGKLTALKATASGGITLSVNSSALAIASKQATNLQQELGRLT